METDRRQQYGALFGSAHQSRYLTAQCAYFSPMVKVSNTIEDDSRRTLSETYVIEEHGNGTDQFYCVLLIHQ
jgi:hypothetical protein